ncbi:DUF2612 domain-containing protein [Silvimonas soli]|uniref:DUF2612 domain-containing protein n=1 Tax=Silvimonas soli TaxID=2980100 RepID=UPI0024B34E73|nr:DUF2612 domain-containing protein [Silvimonas soli]
MAQVSDYTGLITSEHADKPNYMAMVSAVAGAFVSVINDIEAIPPAFDLDLAIGAQLDVLGLWIGLSRNVKTPLNVYFSFDTVGLGFDQGNWKGPFDPSDGITSLDDDTYRIMLRAKIGANNWDSTLVSYQEIMAEVFSGTGANVFAVDNQDMSMSVYISGVIPSAILLALIKGGYLPLKPEGVHVNTYIVTSVDDAPLFGFDVQNQFIAGFDTGAWGTSL